MIRQYVVGRTDTLNLQYIIAEGTKPIQMKIFDMYGRICNLQILNSNAKEVKLNVSHLPAGIYELILYQDDQILQREKLSIIK